MAENEKRKVSINMDDLTFGELELFEDVTGLVMSDAVRQEIVRDRRTGMPLPDPDDPKGRPLKEVKMSAVAMMGMVFLALRREDPNVTLDTVRNMRMSDLDFSIEDDESADGDVDPTPPTEEVGEEPAQQSGESA